MDISGLSVSMSTSSINTGLEVAMLSKVLDSAEIAGEALNEMMEAVAIPGLGENLDIRVLFLIFGCDSSYFDIMLYRTSFPKKAKRPLSNELPLAMVFSSF